MGPPDDGEKKKGGWLKWLQAGLTVGSAVAPVFVKNPESVKIMNQSIKGAGLGLDIADRLGIGTIREKQ